MKLVIKGDLNPSYAQQLCLIFFPGEKFSEHEERVPGEPTATFTVTDKGDRVSARAVIRYQGKKTEATHTEQTAKWETSKKASRIAAGVAMLGAGSKMFDSTPPWGILTGVRPAKLALAALEKHGNREDVIRELMKEYFVSPKKAALVTDVAIHEADIVKKYGEGTCSLYISIPFCPTRCAYCSFISYATKRLLSLIPEYIVRLKSDLDRIFKVIEASGKRLVTVYIGGGTPTILNEEQLEDLLSAVDSHLKNLPEPLLEYTVEAGRPDTITAEKLAIAVRHGVTRVSINPQTLSDDVLRAIGRRHTAEDFFRAFALAKESGIPHINTDLIAGLPGDTFRSFSDTVDRIAALEPDNITVHTFCVKKSADILSSGVPIYSRTGTETGKCVDYSQLSAAAHGYVPYYIYRQKNSLGNFENVGFAKPGAEGYYNIFIMEEIHDIYAIGAGAVTKLVDRANNRIERIFMPKYPYEYLSMEDIDGVFAKMKLE